MICGFLLLCCPTYKYCTMCFDPDDVILANNFEEPFSDIYGKGAWSELSETVASNVHENIVAVASFSGDFTVLFFLLSHTCI